jgi:dihydrofolate reductase
MRETAPRRLIYSLMVSLDGYINGSSGELDGSGVDDQLFSFMNEQQKRIDTSIFGRRMYEVMKFWDTAEELDGLSDEQIGFAQQWKRQRKFVVSSTLKSVDGDAVLIDKPLGEVIAQARSQPGADIEIAGATIAADAIRLGLVDEIRMFVQPVIHGGGTPFFPHPGREMNLKLVETRSFDSGVVYLCYHTLGTN